MIRTVLSPSTRRRTVEPALAAFTLALACLWITESSFVFDGRIIATIAGPVFVPATLLAPGLLAVSVLARVVRLGVRLIVAFVSSSDRVQPTDTSLLRTGSSLVLVGVAGITLWWVIESVYAITVADVGGVMLGPVVAVVTGSLLGVLLLGRSVLERLHLTGIAWWQNGTG